MVPIENNLACVDHEWWVEDEGKLFPKNINPTSPINLTILFLLDKNLFHKWCKIGQKNCYQIVNLYDDGRMYIYRSISMDR